MGVPPRGGHSFKEPKIGLLRTIHKEKFPLYTGLEMQSGEKKMQKNFEFFGLP